MAFSVFHRGASALCLAITASALVLPAVAEESELRGTLTDTISLETAPLDTMATGAISPAGNEPVAGSNSSANNRALAEAPARPPALSEDTAVGGRLNLSASTVNDDEPPQQMNQRIQPLKGGSLRRDDDPYAPSGFRVGTFTLFSTLEQGLTSTSNASNSPNGESALIAETRLRLRVNSDWLRHRLNVDSDLNYRRAISGDLDPELSGRTEAELQLDVSHSLKARARLAYEAERESVTSLLAVVGVDQQPVRHRLTGELGLEKSIGPLLLSASGQLARTNYGDARLNSGATLSLDDQNSTLTLATLRSGYEVSPALIPFVEIEAGRRVYDERYDSNGYQRSGYRLAARAGVAVDMQEKLSGEVSAGWLSEDFDDDRLHAVSGLAVAASVQWSPIRGTNVFLDTGTSVEGGKGSDRGSLVYSTTLRVEHQLRSNLTGDLSFGAAWRKYDGGGGGNDLTLHGQASLTWWLNRYAGLVTRVRQERRTSSEAAREYDSRSIFVGMKVQR